MNQAEQDKISAEHSLFPVSKAVIQCRCGETFNRNSLAYIFHVENKMGVSYK